MVQRSTALAGPPKVLIYGVPGVGKTTFAASFKAPILLPTEEGFSSVDIDSFPLLDRFDYVIQAIQSLRSEEHAYRTVILDSLDWLEPLVWAKTCEISQSTKNDYNTIEAAGYGRGYVEADKVWKWLMAELDALRRERRMTVVAVAHSEIKRHDPPNGEAYDRYQIKLHKRALGLWTEWSDLTLFVNFRVQVLKRDAAKPGKAHGDGARVVHTAERPAFLAKSRWPLPEEVVVGLDETWAPFHTAMREAWTKHHSPAPAAAPEPQPELAEEAV